MAWIGVTQDPNIHTKEYYSSVSISSAPGGCAEYDSACVESNDCCRGYICPPTNVCTGGLHWEPGSCDGNVNNASKQIVFNTSANGVFAKKWFVDESIESEISLTSVYLLVGDNFTNFSMSDYIYNYFSNRDEDKAKQYYCETKNSVCSDSCSDDDKCGISGMMFLRFTYQNVKYFFILGKIENLTGMTFYLYNGQILLDIFTDNSTSPSDTKVLSNDDRIVTVDGVSNLWFSLADVAPTNAVPSLSCESAQPV
jgi:hypothetical protein